MYTSLCRYLRVLPVLHRVDVVGIFIFVGVLQYRKHATCQRDYRPQSSISIQYMHGDLCKHFRNRFEYRSNTYHPERYSNLFLNAYIHRHVHAEYLKMIKLYSPFGILHCFLYRINTNIYHIRSTSNTRKYQQIDVYIYQCDKDI